MADFLYIGVTAVIVCVLVVLIWNVSDKIKTVTEPIYTNYTNATMVKVDSWDRIVDIGFMLLFFGMSMVAIIFAYFVRSHPVFFFASIFLIVITVFLAYVGGQVFTNVHDMEVNENVADSFPIMNFVMSNLAMVIIVLICLQAIALYAGYVSGGA